MDNMHFSTFTMEELKDVIREALRMELNQKKEKELLNFNEAKELLRISASSLNKWKRENKIPYKKLGKRIFFSRKDLLNALGDSYFNKLRKLS